MATMRAAGFVAAGQIEIREVPKPEPKAEGTDQYRCRAEAAYDLFANLRDGVMKIGIRP